jgi:hypothetical protein
VGLSDRDLVFVRESAEDLLAFLDAGERPSRTSQPQNRMKIR